MTDESENVEEIVIELDAPDEHAVAVQEMMARVTVELSETLADKGETLALQDVRTAAQLFARYLQSSPLPPDLPGTVNNLVQRWIAALDQLIEDAADTPASEE